jgi:hypothetical protein
MSHCVLTAFNKQLSELNVTPTGYAAGLYFLLKREVQRINEYTNGAWVPYYAAKLALHYGLRLEVEHSIWTPELYLACENSEILERMIQRGIWGREVSQTTLRPAVYLSLAQQHAYYSDVPWDEWTVLAIKLSQEKT